MRQPRDSRSSCRTARPERPGLLAGWFAANSIVAGLFALAWLALRSGTRPSRLSYPCQQAALSTATLALGAPVVAAVIAARRRLAAGLGSPLGMVVAAVVAVVSVAAAGLIVGVDASPRAVAAAPEDYRARVFHIASCPELPAADRFQGLDALVDQMGRGGVRLYRSPVVSLLSGPDGLIGADDVVVVKINYQWPERGGTNTDVLRGLLRLLVDHPDGFTGEIVVAENTQFAGADDFDRAFNNAQDIGQSPRDVVTDLRQQGHLVSLYDWTLIRFEAVDEFSAADMTDGYVVLPYDSGYGGSVAYPKFTTSDGTFVSLKHGIWDPVGVSYDRDRLRIINLPVLKSHHSTYGVTACVKNWMGVVTTGLSTNAHGAMRYGLLGAAMAEVGPADLNILDAVWINADPFTGPATPYTGATRRNELVASTDAVAADMWAATEILIPAFLANGFTPPWPQPDATPDDPASDFRQYLDSSMTELLAAGIQATNDPDRIMVVSIDYDDAVLVDGFESGGTFGWSSSVP